MFSRLNRWGFALLGFASLAAAAAPADPPIIANSMRTATDVPVCTAFNCSPTVVPVTCTPNMCAAAPVPPAPCENGMCRSDKAAAETSAKG